jgi:pimeloyl-ACP methyl ester carboxylesterase
MTSPLVAELRGLGEVPRLLARFPWLLRVPHGDGGPVLVIPGRGADDLSTVPLRLFLRTCGHDPSGWGLGTNGGDLGRLVPSMSDRVLELASQTGSPVPLVGQSMGGSIAREVARRHPDAVSRVITLGSPILSTMSRRPLACPLTVIYSEVDRIVPPNWALAPGDGAEIVEVSSTHFSMGIDPDVWQVVAERLAGVPLPGPEPVEVPAGSDAFDDVVSARRRPSPRIA